MTAPTNEHEQPCSVSSVVKEALPCHLTLTPTRSDPIRSDPSFVVCGMLPLLCLQGAQAHIDRYLAVSEGLGHTHSHGTEYLLAAAAPLPATSPVKGGGGSGGALSRALTSTLLGGAAWWAQDDDVT